MFSSRRYAHVMRNTYLSSTHSAIFSSSTSSLYRTLSHHQSTSLPYQLKNDATTVTSYVSKETYANNKKNLDKDLIVRKTKEQRIVMQATHLLDVLPPGSDLHLSRIPLCNETESANQKMNDSHSTLIPISEVEVTVQAKWIDPMEKAIKNELNANVFGSYGCFELVNRFDPLDLPVVDLNCLSDHDLQSYRATRLTPNNASHYKFNTFNDSLFVVIFDYSKDYLRDYALQADLGSGWFIETHNFPHFFKPMHPDCDGAAILGKLVSKDEEANIGTYKLVSIKINYPDTLVIESDVIHGNASFVGPYAIPSNPSGKASIVVMRDNQGGMQTVTQPHYQRSSLFCQQAPSVKVENTESRFSLQV
jgi:hypothetical protein